MKKESFVVSILAVLLIAAIAIYQKLSPRYPRCPTSPHCVVTVTPGPNCTVNPSGITLDPNDTLQFVYCAKHHRKLHGPLPSPYI